MMMMRRMMKLMSNCHPILKTPTTRVGPIRSLLYQIQIKSMAENDRMIQIMKGRLILDPFPNKPWFLCICCTSLLKTLWEKEKLLVSSNFSFSSQCFLSVLRSFAFFIKLEFVVCKLFQFGRVLNLLFGKGLNATPSCFLFGKKVFLLPFLELTIMSGNSH